MKNLTIHDIDTLKSIKRSIQSTSEQLSPEVKLYLYDNVYRPVNDLLVAHGHAKPDDGQLS
jgi:hypothetical protein